MSRRSWAFDVVVTLLVMSTFVLRSDVRGVSGTSAVIQMLCCLPLVVRRVHPAPVFWTLAALFATVPLWSEITGPNLALLVALYTVAAYQSRLRAAVAAVGLDIVFITTLNTSPQVTLTDSVIFTLAATAAAIGLGLWTATRRTYLAELKDRAERLERERDQQHELAVQTERARMTREMHDIVAHHLTVVVALSDAAARTAVKSPERAAEVMRQVSATGRQALAETRRVLDGNSSAQNGSGADPHDRDPVPDLGGLDALLENVRAAGLPVAYEVTGRMEDVVVGPGVQLTLYRLVQESLTNTMKHAGAGASARVGLSFGKDEVLVTIEDDGGGLRAAPAPERGGGRGLTGMRERVHAYGGEVGSGPMSPAGWQVHARIGVRPE
ncbi:sensor histidine kinase [Kineosporia sp. NBRC 101731]|uniref:sensor histidine kinase n=1 Tax=Kineosporia sp. NBRC 101731 TaxID=3032199 RepID=UPI0024A1737A|nr:sensor histidine kinase [Kineosporia sp. NBRC 101731]GLY31748.1 two-component sensor histidine kinase [Kineosporia sp. NBRC 101731]